MFTTLKNAEIEVRPVNKANPNSIKGKGIYHVGKLRYNDMKLSSGLLRRYNAWYCKNSQMRVVVLGNIGQYTTNGIEIAQKINKNASKKAVHFYWEDDFLVLLGEKRYYLENDKKGSFIFCHQDIYKPDDCLVTTGELGALGEQKALSKTKIEDLLQKYKSEGFEQKEVPKRWDLMRRFFLANSGARQKAAKGAKSPKITDWNEFHYFVEQGLSPAHLLSHHTSKEYCESVQKITIEDLGFNRFKKRKAAPAPQWLENFPNLRELHLSAYNEKATKIAFDMSKMPNLRILSFLSQKKYGGQHNMNRVPDTVFDSPSLLKLDIIPPPVKYSGAKQFKFTKDEKIKLKQLFTRNSLFALCDEMKKNRDLAFSVLVENLDNPFEGDLEEGGVFVSSGKLKGFKAKDIKQNFEAQGLRYIENFKSIDHSNVIFIVGDQPEKEAVETAIKLGWAIAIPSMFNDYIRQQSEKPKKELKAPENLNESELKKNLKELLNHPDLENVKLGLEIASAQEILEEAHDEIFMMSLFHPVPEISEKAKSILHEDPSFQAIFELKPLEEIKAWKLIETHPKLNTEVVFPKVLNHVCESTETAKHTLAAKIIKTYGKTYNLLTETLILAAFGATTSVKNRCKTILKNHADYKINDFIKNKWNGRLKGELAGIPIFKEMLEHPQIDKNRLTYLLALHHSYHINTRSYNAADNFYKEFGIFALENETVSALPDAHRDRFRFPSLQKQHLTAELSKFSKITHLYFHEYSNDQSQKLGKLPENILNFSDLSILAISGHALESLPKSLAKNKELEALDISRNNFKHFPEIILQFSKLKRLKLNNNKIPELPMELSQLTDLEELEIDQLNGENQISGSILDLIAKFPKLRRLQISHLPDDADYSKLQVLSKLRSLKMPHCHLTKETLLILNQIPELNFFSYDNKFRNLIQETLPDGVGRTKI